MRTLRVLWDNMAVTEQTLDNDDADEVFYQLSENGRDCSFYDKETKTYVFLNRAHIMSATLEDDEECKSN